MPQDPREIVEKHPLFEDVGLTLDVEESRYIPDGDRCIVAFDFDPSPVLDDWNEHFIAASVRLRESNIRCSIVANTMLYVEAPFGSIEDALEKVRSCTVQANNEYRATQIDRLARQHELEWRLVAWESRTSG